jgi:hypothetical protein
MLEASTPRDPLVVAPRADDDRLDHRGRRLREREHVHHLDDGPELAEARPSPDDP